MTAMLRQPLPFRPRLRVDDFILLASSGALADATKSELLDGDLVCMNAQFRRHAYAKNELTFRLQTRLRAMASDIVALSEASVAMLPYDMPEPDIVLTTSPLGDGAVDVATVVLLVEVADTTLDRDLGYKAALYAREGIAEYWVVDLPRRLIHRCWRPHADSFAARDSIAFGDPVQSMTIAELEVETHGLD